MDLDLYCERLGPGLLAEPVNAITNGAFFVAAWWSWRQGGRHLGRRQSGRVEPGLAVLIALVVAIGIGSSLFHTTASRWALLADVVPILLFQLTYLWLYLRRRLARPPGSALGLVALFLLATLASRSWPELLNGSLAYGPTLLVLAWMGARELANEGRPTLLLAAGAFALSLTLRSVDQLVCPWLATGTHPGWHLLNALVLALACRALPPPRWQAESTRAPDSRSHGR